MTEAMAPRLLATLPDRLDAVREVLRAEYRKSHRWPWIVAYSGGKDSTLLAQLVWEIVAELPAGERQRPVLIVGNDTLVESPLVIRHLRDSMEAIAAAAQRDGLPISTEITRPAIDQTFWVKIIGRGYIPPTRNFRWCTDRMKILPTTRLLKRIVHGEKGAILLIGTRRAESQSRRRNMERRDADADADGMNPHSTVAECRMFAPLADLSDDDVWLILIQRRPPWGGDHRRLITLYRNAGGGECPLVMTKEQAPSCGSSSPRFGCWTCTVVQKDRSLRGLIDSGHAEAERMAALADFREWLIALREDNANRMPVRRDGNAKYRADGSLVYGPFTLAVRRRILERLRELERQIGEQLISPAEIDCIEDVWWRDEIRENARQALIQSIETGSCELVEEVA